MSVFWNINCLSCYCYQVTWLQFLWLLIWVICFIRNSVQQNYSITLVLFSIWGRYTGTQELNVGVHRDEKWLWFLQWMDSWVFDKWWCHALVLSSYLSVWKDDVRRKTEQPHLSATVQAWRLCLFGHIVQMPDESDAKQILTASPLENWRRPPGRPHSLLRGWRLLSRTWNHWIIEFFQILRASLPNSAAHCGIFSTYSNEFSNMQYSICVILKRSTVKCQSSPLTRSVSCICNAFVRNWRCLRRSWHTSLTSECVTWMIWLTVATIE